MKPNNRSTAVCRTTGLYYFGTEIKSDVQGKNQISFYSSDLPGRYALVVQGLTNNGEPGEVVLFFNVKK
jgi:hypothetical protein